MKKDSLKVFIVCIALAIVAFVLISVSNNTQFALLSSKPMPSAIPTPTPFHKPLKLGQNNLSVMVADNENTRDKGLGGVKSLAENEGMIFDFGIKKVSAIFWMKGMLIPLDFIWISNNKVLEITPNVPIPSPSDNDPEKYSPSNAIDYVLEVNAGYAKSHNVKVGDTVSF